MVKIKFLISTIISIILLFFLLSFFYSTTFYNQCNLGCGYWYDREGKRLFGPNDIIIPPYIEEFDYNATYIVVKQKPLQQREEIQYERIYDYPMGRDSIYYWIINKREHKSWGPILNEEYYSILKKERINIKL